MAHQHPLSAMKIQENEMIDRSEKALHAGEFINPIEKLRHLCLARGFNGMLDFGRVFRRMHVPLKESLMDTMNESQFMKGFQYTGLPITFEEAKDIFNS